MSVNRIIELVRFRVFTIILSVLTVIVLIGFYKHQCISENRLIEYNRETDLWIDQLGSVF